MNVPHIYSNTERMFCKNIQLSIILLSIFFTLPTHADFKNGVAAYGRKDYTIAYQEFHTSAIQGDIQAQVELGTLYFTGTGVPQNYNEAFKWFSQAAKQNSAIGQAWLAVLYRDGKGVPKNLVNAYAWILLSSAQNYNDAVEFKKVLEKNLTPQQITRSQSLAKQWYEHPDQIGIPNLNPPQSSTVPQKPVSSSQQSSTSHQIGRTLGDISFGLGQVVAPVVQGLTESLIENSVKGTMLEEPTREALHPNEAIVIRRELSECVGKDGVVNQKVLDCMHGK